MTPPSCPRAWEVEALEDGRLTGSERESFERHARSCAACVAERGALAALGDAMGAADVAPMTPLERQRARRRLLEGANRGLLGKREVPRLAVLVVAALVVLAAVVGLGFGPRWHEPTATADGAPLAAPLFLVQGSAGARWKSRTIGAVTQLELESGSVEVDVAHLEVGQRFLVAVPGGELEVRGTKFLVDVRDGRVEHVVVREGSVAWRATGKPDVLLAAGDEWPPSEKEPRAAVSSARATAADAHPPDVVAVARPAASKKRPAGEAFEEAMVAFGKGEYTAAEGDLARFQREYPSDPRCEDAAYLRAVARWRQGDRERAAVLAREYLDAYPGGLRRREAEDMIPER